MAKFELANITSSIWRAKEIEEKLDMSLYRDGWKKIQETKTFSSGGIESRIKAFHSCHLGLES